MTKREQVYKCEVCGNIVEVIHTGQGQLVCCGRPMTLQAENTAQAAPEKHVPQVAQDGANLVVRVASSDHPMSPEHFIEWIELIDADRVERHYLMPGGKPVTTFTPVGTPQMVRAYCNLHGLWSSHL